MLAPLEIAHLSPEKIATFVLEEMMSLLRADINASTQWYDKVQPYLQPIHSLESRQTTHYEVLARFFVNDQYVIEPAAMFKWLTAMENVKVFIQLLEKTAHIDLPLTFNLSCDVFLDGKAFELLEKSLPKSVLSDRSIIIEIAETQLEEQSLRDLTLKNNLKRLHKRGVCFAIDDFGVAGSNYDRLRRFDNIVSIVKVDKNFFWDMTKNVRKGDIFLNSSADMGNECSRDNVEVRLINFIRSMSVSSIVFEGIETEEHLRMIEKISKLISADVYGQGYYLGRPTKISDAPLLDKADKEMLSVYEETL
ncbi:EAL domain-containing protein [Marinomonas sp. TI.3.20]|uniref:EAL domain-containing protein n=1 Tax=Marinomonas sp. TI.3.20 TaxID=3121296 RepID=UPI00311ED1B0